MNLLILSFLLISSGKSENAFAKYADYKTAIRRNEFISDTNSIKKKLPIYHAVPCIDKLLRQVVEVNHKYYDPNKYFYSLSFKKEGGKRYLVIESSLYNSCKVFDYLGAMKISGSTFLCRGDIAADTLFIVNRDVFLDVYLKNTKKSNEFNFGFEPSLRGLYQECNGIKINLEIYTRAPLPGYRMIEENSKKPDS